MRTITITLLFFACWAIPCSSTTIHVDGAGGGDYLTIQEGVAAAGEGDTVQVAPGTYAGIFNRDIDFGGTNIVLMSEAGASLTVIDVENNNYFIELTNGETTASVVDGFTVTRANIAVLISHSSATIKNCTFFENVSTSNGGAMWISYATPSPLISNCLFFGNAADSRGGPIFADRSSPTITNCTFYGNIVTTTTYSSTYGGGALNFYYNSSPAVIEGCTFANNGSAVGGGAIHTHNGGITLTNSVVSFSGDGEGVRLYSGSVSQCVIFGNADGDTIPGQPDNLYQDPRFCDIYSNNWTLCANSPCLAANNPWSELIGAYGQGCGDCEAGIEPVTWGNVKQLLR